MPEPRITPQRNGSSFEKSSPESFTASMPATIANCVKRSIRFSSLRSTYPSVVQLWMSPANFTLCWLVSNARSSCTPLWPRRIFCQRSSTLQLSDVTAPMPVTTTRRFIERKKGSGFRVPAPEPTRNPEPRTLACDPHPLKRGGVTVEKWRSQVPRSTLPVRAFLDVLNGLADGLDLLRGVVRNVDVELFFELHHEFDRVERVGAQIVYERRFRSDLFPVDAQVIGDDVFYSFHY